MRASARLTGPAATYANRVPPSWPMRCPLCLSDGSAPYQEVDGREYFQCTLCRLTFLRPDQMPPPEAERAHYGTHQNDPADPRYHAFLGRLAEPLLRRVPAGSEGLDYGSGPGPALHLLFQAHGHRVRHYDPFFAPDAEALRRTYDFVACSETAEHFHRPAEEFRRLDSLLRPGGWLGLMTEMLDEDAVRFPAWRYRRDPTHVCFYQLDTMRWLAMQFRWEMESRERNVFLFQKAAAGA